jgi:predicted dehydrogenase
MAVVGVGALGQHHARKLAKFSDVDLIGVADSRADQGQSVAAQCDTTWFPDTDSLRQHRLDAAVIAVPTIAHQDVATPFISSGVPVLIEKPLAASLEESRCLHELAVAQNSLIQVGHIERFNPAFQIAEQRVCQPLYIRCQRVSPHAFRSMDIGVVHDLMIHDIDLVRALIGDSEVVSVDAFGAVTIGPQEDFAVARIRFASGAIADLTAGRMCPAAERSMQIWDTSGVVSVDLNARTVSVRTPNEPFATHPEIVQHRIAAAQNPMELKPAVFDNWMGLEEISGDMSDALEAELREFVDCMKNSSTPRVTSREAVSAMEIADKILAEISLYSYQQESSGQSGSRAA